MQAIFIKAWIGSLFSSVNFFIILLLRKNIIKQINKLKYTNILSDINILSSNLAPIKQNNGSLKEYKTEKWLLPIMNIL